MSDPDAPRPRVTAMGGTREVPLPDPIARDYLLLALRLDQHLPGLVDGYFGPADLKARVDLEPLAAPARLAGEAEGLRARVGGELEAGDRRDWLDGQLLALATQAAALASGERPYLEHVTSCFGWTPVRRDERRFDEAAADLERLLPGDGPLGARLDAFDERFRIQVDRLPAVVDWLLGRLRARAAATFGLPEGESVRVKLVRGQPWTGYNWFEGGGRSRVDLNIDRPVTVDRLVHVLAHETYPGHHLEHAWKETTLVEGRGRLEAAVLLINTPECLISEGLADLGIEFAVPADDAIDVRLELFERAGLAVAADGAAARAAAGQMLAMAAPRRILAEARVNAALLRHGDGWTHKDVLGWLRRVGRLSEHEAAQRLEFIEHPLWRTYVFVYHEGEALLRRWLDAVPAAARAARLGRLLHEQLTPRAIATEVAAAETVAGAASAS